MRLSDFRLLFYFCALILTDSIWPQTIRLEPSDERISVGQYSEYFRDTSGRLTLEDVRNLEKTKWKVTDRRSLNFGYSADTIWLRFFVKNDSGRNDWLLEAEYPVLDNIRVYKPALNESYELSETGRLLPFKHREIDNKNFLFRLPLQARDARPVYAAIRSQSSLNCELTIWEPQALAKRSNNERLLDGLYYGVLTIMAFYNLSLFLSIRDLTYFFYSLYVIFVGLFQFTIDGLAFQYFFPELPYVATQGVNVFSGMLAFWATIFAARFLDLRVNFPSVLPLIYASRIASIVQIVGSLFWSYSVAVRIGTGNGLTLPIILLVSAIVCMKKGYRPARYFLAAWVGLLVTLFIWSIARYGLIPNTVLTEHGWKFGAAFEVWLLSLALGDRINALKTETALEQKRSLDRQVLLTRSYARFVPEQFLHLLGKEDILQVQLGDAVRREMTVLFTDIRSFTSLSESMSPDENFRFLNAMLKQTGPLIRQHHGFIDKYMGDAIMALFAGEPEDALRAAIAMRRSLADYNIRRKSQGFESVKIGIGINTGPLILGTIGEPERMEGTVISDAVNLASRMEGLTKFYDSSILITDRTFSRIADPSNYNFRVLDKVTVSGKNESVSVIEILDGDEPDLLAVKLATRPDFERGIYAYLNRDFTDALEHFEKVLIQNSADRAAQLYRERAGYYATHGVPPGWDAVETFKEK